MILNSDQLQTMATQMHSQGCPYPTKVLEPHLRLDCNLRKIEALLVTSQEIKVATQQDPVLSKIKSYILKGWPDQVPKSLQVYRSKLAELTVEEGCLLWGGRVIIPQSLKDVVKAELHKEHLGISKMKALARGYVWWAGIDKELETLAKSCTECATVNTCQGTSPSMDLAQLTMAKDPH